MLITCRKCGKRYKMPTKPVDQLPEAVKCKGCSTIIPIRETVKKAVASKGDVRKVSCQDCGKTYRMTIRNLPGEVTQTTCKACGGVVPLQAMQPQSVGSNGSSTPSAIDNLFNDASLGDTPDFDMTGLMSGSDGAITHSDSTGAETLPLNNHGGEDADTDDHNTSESVEIDFDKITRMIKVLVIGALVILIVGMTFTRIRMKISEKIAEREAIKQAQEAEVERLTSSRSNKGRSQQRVDPQVEEAATTDVSEESAEDPPAEDGSEVEG